MSRTTLFRGLSAAFAFSGLAPSAHAVMLDPRGLGQVLVFPYYTVNAGQDTLLTVVNTSGVGKAVKVTFREGYNGRETLTFDLFLSAHDSWVGAVSAIDGSAASGGRLSSPDHSCVDHIPAFPYPFSSAAYTGAGAGPGGASYAKDSGPQTIDRTREGFIEMIEIGDIAPGSATDLATTPVQTGNPDEGIPPCNLPTSASINDDLVAPTGGLAGTGAIANVGEGTFYTYVADALVGFAHAPLRGPASGPFDPDLGSAQPTPPHGVIATVLDANGEALQIDYARGIDAVSAVFMADALHNDFLVADALGANTDWIITFPTKQFYVDKFRYPVTVTSPFELPFAGGDSRFMVSTAEVFDNDGNPGWLADFSSCHPSPVSFCPFPASQLRFQTNTLAFFPPTHESSGVFGSKLVSEILPDFEGYYDPRPISDAGHLTLDLHPDAGLHELEGGIAQGNVPITLRGLPVTGFMAYNIINTNAAPGRLANYGGTFRHRTHWSCAGDIAACE